MTPLRAVVVFTRQLFRYPTYDAAAWRLEHPVIASVAWSLAITIIICMPQRNSSLPHHGE